MRASSGRSDPGDDRFAARRHTGDTLLVVGAIVFVLALVIAVIHYASSGSGSDPAAISSRNPALKDSAWEANGARQAIASAKELCKEAGVQLLGAPATAQWDDATAAFGIETSPGRYRVRRSVAGRSREKMRARTTIDCRVRRDADHFQILAIDSSSS